MIEGVESVAVFIPHIGSHHIEHGNETGRGIEVCLANHCPVFRGKHGFQLFGVFRPGAADQLHGEGLATAVDQIRAVADNGRSVKQDEFGIDVEELVVDVAFVSSPD